MAEKSGFFVSSGNPTPKTGGSPKQQPDGTADSGSKPEAAQVAKAGEKPLDIDKLPKYLGDGVGSVS